MFTNVKVDNFYKKHIVMILDEIVDPMYAYLEENTHIFDSFQNQLLSYDLKHKSMYLIYNILVTNGEIIQDLIKDMQRSLKSLGLEQKYYEGCVTTCFKRLEGFVFKNFSLSDDEKDKWIKKLQEIQEFALQNYDTFETDDGFFEQSHDHNIKDLDVHHYEEEHKTDAVTFMNENDIDPDEIAEIRDLIEALEENIEINYQEGLNDELIENFKELISKMIGFYELSGEFRTLTHPMNHLFSLLESLDPDSLDDMMKDVIFNFLNNTVKDMKKWIYEVLIDQSTNDIHYLDASMLASISQMEMMIAGDEDDNEDDNNEDDDFLF